MVVATAFQMMLGSQKQSWMPCDRLTDGERVQATVTALRGLLEIGIDSAKKRAAGQLGYVSVDWRRFCRLCLRRAVAAGTKLVAAEQLADRLDSLHAADLPQERSTPTPSGSCGLPGHPEASAC